MPRIVTFTMNPAIDVSMEIPQLIPDRKLRGSQTHKDPGGGGVNVARALARLGKKSTALVACGGETGLLHTNLLYSLTENYPIEKAVRFGIAAGASAVITPGTELCRKNDTLKLFDQLQNN